MTNATITVAYEGKTVVIELEDDELSPIWMVTADPPRIVGYHLGNASREHVANEVERALLEVTGKPS